MLGFSIHIHWLCVALSTLALTVFGGVCFVAVVPRYYVRALGRENLPPYKPAPKVFAVQITCTFLTVLTTAALYDLLKITSLQDSLLLGVLVGVGYLLPMAFNIAENPNFPRPALYGFINAPYFLFGSLITCGILNLLA